MKRPAIVAISISLASAALVATARAGDEAGAAPAYEFHADWTTSNEAGWREHLGHLAGVAGAQGLEIGCFEGRSTIWFAEHVLTGPDARMSCIDVFSGTMEQRFDHNIAVSPVAGKVTKYRGYSQDVLRGLPLGTYDFVYIDGCHLASCVLTDAVMSWDLLKPGGLYVFDDYRWNPSLPPAERPKIAIDAFVAAFGNQVEVVADTRRQLFVRKVSEDTDSDRVGKPLVRILDPAQGAAEPAADAPDSP